MSLLSFLVSFVLSKKEIATKKVEKEEILWMVVNMDLNAMTFYIYFSPAQE